MRTQADPSTQPTGPLARLARRCYRCRRLVVLTWTVGAAALLTAGIRYAAPADNDFSGGRSESAQAQRLLAAHVPGSTGDTLTLAIRADAGAGMDDPAVRARVERLLARLAAAPGVAAVSSPYQAPG